MANRVAVFIDVGNQFYCINKKWEGRKLNYETYKDKVANYGEIVRAFAYGTQVEGAAKNFISCLYHLGYETNYKDIEKNTWYSWTAGMFVDMVQMAERIDTMIIGTSDKSIAPAIKHLKNLGIRTVVMACGIPREIREACDQWVEISEDMLEKQEDIKEEI